MFATITFSIDVPVYPERVYRAWLDNYEHSQFTGLTAQIQGIVGSSFTSLNGRVSGELLRLSPFDRIVQSWKMQDFPENDPGSEIELIFEPTCTGAEITLFHRGINPGSTRVVMQWWENMYFRPLRAYFDILAGDIPADLGDG